MNLLKFLVVSSALAMAASACSGLPSGNEAMRSGLSKDMAAVMEATGARGLAVAKVGGGESLTIARGERNEAGDPLTTDTVMYGASLTKTAFAYLVLQLADEGLLGLDQPVAEILPKPLPEYEGFRRTHAPWETLDDERWRQITPRMVLTHSTGFRNFNFVTLEGQLKWDDGTVDIHFDPGTQYSYSGEGFILLQFVIEQGLGIDVGQAMRDRIFDPLGMMKTDLIWRDDFAENLADGWDVDGNPERHDDRSKVRASGSMDTTITDQAKLWRAIVTCKQLSDQMCTEFFAPSLPIRTASQFPLMQNDAPEDQQVRGLAAGMGLIVGAGPQGKFVFKGGHNNTTGNMAVCLVEQEECVVILANDVRAERGFNLLVDGALGKTGMPWSWEYSGAKMLD